MSEDYSLLIEIFKRLSKEKQKEFLINIYSLQEEYRIQEEAKKKKKF